MTTVLDQFCTISNAQFSSLINQQNYGGAARILNDTVMTLTQRKKPAASDRPDRYLHISAIIAALQRLEKLICSNPTHGIGIAYTHGIL